MPHDARAAAPHPGSGWPGSITRLLLRRKSQALIAIFLAGVGAGCDGDRDLHEYSATGIVREVQPEFAQAVIEHGDIEGLMPAMTMNFDVEPRLLERMVEGQVIDFTIRYSSGTGYRITGFTVRGEAPAAAGGTRMADLAAPNEMAPDFELIDQSGESVSLDGLRGKLVLLDFVYTSCPGPCPILTSSHVSLQRMLPKELRQRVRFVSISLDPGRDTPEKLRAYAEARGADLDGWSFLTGPADEVERVVRDYGVGSVRGENGEIEHQIVTFLIDSDGRIVRRYLGLDHDAEALLGDLERWGS